MALDAPRCKNRLRQHGKTSERSLRVLQGPSPGRMPGQIAGRSLLLATISSFALFRYACPKSGSEMHFMLSKQYSCSKKHSRLQDCLERMALATMKTASATSAGHTGILSMVRPSLSFTMSNEKEFNLLKKSCFSLRTVPRIKIVLRSLVECCCAMSLLFVVWMMIAHCKDLLSLP